MNVINVDCKILKFISQSHSVSKKDILKNIPDDEYGTNSRLDNLILLKAIEYASVKNSQFTGYEITTIGTSLLNELESQLFNQKKQNFIEKERIEREKKHLQLAEEAILMAKKAKKEARLANRIAFFSLLIAIIALFKK